jgi:uncharacterized protein YrrD
MLHLAHEIAGTVVRGTDGELGTLKDFYFRDDDWTVRYLLVDTGTWFGGKKVLVSPASVEGDWGKTGVHLNLTQEEVRHSPALNDTAGEADNVDAQPFLVAKEGGSLHHLRSVNSSKGYHIHATNGEIGHVDDFLIGQESWRIRYLLVDTSNWIGGRSVIVSSDALERVDQEHGKLYVTATREAIEHAPSFESIEEALDAAETGPPFSII